MFSKPSTPNNSEKPPLPDDGDEAEEDVRTKSFGCLVSDAVSNTGMQGQISDHIKLKCFFHIFGGLF